MSLDELSDENKAYVKLVHSRCVEEGECILWTGHTTSSGYPSMNRVGRYRIVRRELASLKLGRKLGQHEFASSTCNEPTCLCWDHIRVVTITKRRRETAAAGGYSAKTKGMRIAISRRKQCKLIGGEQSAQAIRADPRPSHIVAPEYGVSASMIRNIRRGHSWVPHTNPFAGLGARS